jgi:hypothetical protein
VTISLCSGSTFDKQCRTRPATGHAVNLEEVDLFNRLSGEFLAQIDSGRWRPRDPRSFNKSNLLKS